MIKANCVLLGCKIGRTYLHISWSDGRYQSPQPVKVLTKAQKFWRMTGVEAVLHYVAVERRLLPYEGAYTTLHLPRNTERAEWFRENNRKG